MGRRRKKSRGISEVKKRLALETSYDNPPMDAAAIRQVVSHYYTNKLWAVHFEVGLCKGGRYRADILAMAMNSYLVLVEVKSSVADFRADKKMEQYLLYSNQAYLAVTPQVYEKIKEKILPGFGVFLVTPRSCWVERRAPKREIPVDTKLNLITRLAYRTAQTLYERKSKTAGAKYIVGKMLDAVSEVPKPRTRKQIAAHVETQLKGLL